MATNTTPGWTTRETRSLKVAVRVFKATYRHLHGDDVEADTIATFRAGGAVGAVVEVHDDKATNPELYLLTVASGAVLLTKLLPVGAKNALSSDGWAHLPLVLAALAAIDPAHQVHEECTRPLRQEEWR